MQPGTVNIADRNVRISRAPKACWLWVLCAFLSLVLLPLRVLAATPAGTQIINVAEATYFDEEAGKAVRVVSNIASVVVGQGFAVALHNPRTLNVRAGQTVNLGHRLVNTGNVADSFQLTAANLTGDDADFLDIRVIEDRNGNGVADPGEPRVSQTAPLPPGGALDLVVTGTVPGSAGASHRLALRLTAQSQAHAEALAEVTDTASLLADTAFLDLKLTASSPCEFPLERGAELRYTLEFTNIGDRPPPPRVILVDGAARQGALVTATLSPYAALLKPQPSFFRHAPVQGVTLVHRSQDPADVWHTLAQWNGTDRLARIGLLVPPEHLRPNQSGALAWAMRVDRAPYADERLQSVAEADLDGDGRAEFQSNPVCNAVNGPPPTAKIRFLQPVAALRRTTAAPDFWRDADFEDARQYRIASGETTYNALRDGIYIEVQMESFRPIAQWADGKPTVIRVRLESTGTGDWIDVVMLETQPFSGVYRSIEPVVTSDRLRGNGSVCPARAARLAPDATPLPSYTATPDGACVLLTRGNDTLRVTFRESRLGPVLLDAAVVDPLGTVFDSQSGQPVAGATVYFHTADGAPAHDPDAGEAESAASTTRADGQFRFPRLGSGAYYLRVEPPPSHDFPSTVAPDALRAQFGRQVGAYSYGRDGPPGGGASSVFQLDADGDLPRIDVPLDPAVTGNLTVEKRASRPAVGLADVVAYEVVVSNRSTQALRDVRLRDQPPYGFKYVERSARWDGKPIDGPLRFTPELEFALGTLAPGARTTVSYALRTSAGAVDGDGLNRASAEGRTASDRTLRSTEARVKVQVRPEGVLSDNAIVFGKVYLDADCNRIQSRGEWPIGGVKLYLENGSFAITDEHGQYSLYGLKPGLHAIKVDPLTLIEGLRLKPLGNRHLADGDSRLLDLVPGEFHRADFAAACPPSDQVDRVLAQIKARNALLNGAWALDEAARLAPEPGANLAGDRTQRDRNRLGTVGSADGDLSQGILNGSRSQRDPRQAQTAPRPPDARPSAPSPQPANTREPPEPQPPKASEIVKSVTRAQAKAAEWLWPPGELSDDGRLMIVLPANIEPRLTVNGEEVPRSQLGEQIVNKAEQAQVLAWYGVNLREGENAVEVVATDPFGNRRVLTQRALRRPGVAERIELKPERDTLEADGGRSTLPVRVRLLDRFGQPAHGVYFVTLQASDGQWVEPDIQDREPGHQIRIRGGERTVHLRSSEFTGQLTIRAAEGRLREEVRLTQVAPMRPLVAIGVVDGTVRRNALDTRIEAPTRQREGLADGTRAQGRSAVFMKGRVRGDLHLTLSYDTDKRGEETLLRDIDPAETYPILGDASVRGYEAQSRSKLYAKLERGKHSLMWGDFLTDAQTPLSNVARTQYTLTGANALFDTGGTRLQALRAETEALRFTEELRGNGTAMFYRLSRAPIVQNSEVIELIVRGRDNPGLILSAETLTRFGDYQLDHLTGNLTFFRTIPAFDEERNPMFLRVTYDLAGKGAPYTVTGWRLVQRICKGLTAGVSHTNNAHPTEGSKLTGSFVEYRSDDDRTRIAASVGRMTQDTNGSEGKAWDVQLEQRWNADARTQVKAARAEAGFNNPGSGVLAGREEARLAHSQRLNERQILTVEGTHSRALSGERDSRSAVGALIDTTLPKAGVKLRVGVRQIAQEHKEEREHFSTFVLGVSKGFELLGRQGTVGVEFERAFADAERKRVLLSGEVKVLPKASVYADFEHIDSLAGVAGVSDTESRRTLSAGVKTDLLPGTQLYSEYRVRGVTDGRDFATANGVRGNFEPVPNLTVVPRVEVVDTLRTEGKGSAELADGVATSIAIKDARDPNRRLTAQIETRQADASDYYGVRGSFATRLDRDWSGMVREQLTLQVPDEGARKYRSELAIGVTRRPKLDNRYHLLVMYKWIEEFFGMDANKRHVHLFATHHNYELSSALTLFGRLGHKHVTSELADGLETTGDAWLLDGRVTWDVDRRWDIDLRAGLLATDGGKSLRHAAGFGVHYLLNRNLRVGSAYNLAGFRDRELDPQGYNARGFQLDFQFKFDEDLLGWLSDAH